MTTSKDVSATPRKNLTRTQRLKLFENHRGICGICGVTIIAGETWCVEHLRPLGLGGSNDSDNLAPVHSKCADTKDSDDIPRIAKAKRQKMASLGIKKEGPGIRSRGFPKKERPDKIPLPPRRSLYEEE
jgi:5-methylcytosine-specific restriction protein A